jgi:cytochrome c peroxidase
MNTARNTTRKSVMTNALWALTTCAMLGGCTMELGDGDAPPATGFSLEPLVLEPSAAVLDRLGTRRIDSGARGDAREPGYLDFADSSSRYDVREAFLRWELSAPATTYRVVIHYALSSGSRPGRLLFNGEPVADLAFDATGSWSSWSQEVLELESDRPLESVTIQPTTTRGGPNVDYVELFALEEPVRVDDLTPGELSTPSAATYTRLDSRPRAFASRVRTPFNGNGHAENWDGRIFVARRAPGGAGGWYAQTFRPERVTLGADGAPNFSEAFGERIPLETDAENPNLDHNWLALAPDPSVTTENPYPSDARGRYALAGTHRTYKALVYSTNERGRGGVDREVRTLGLRRATFVVQDAHTRDAELVSAEFDGAWVPFEVNGTRNGLDCIEPTITNDGRLVVCQGHQDNGGRIDRLVYSWNAVPGRAAGWSFPMPLAQMHQVRDVDVAGVPFGVRFPLAQRPLRDQRGVEYAPTDEIRGAYPWISRDGSELFYQASRQGVSARRSATTVVGRWTGWNMRHIDGPINFMIGSSRLFLSSPGSFTTMWSPYKDVPDLPLPYSVRGPSYPLFHSNGSDYSEVSFEDYLDGNYVLFYGMNHQVDRDGNYLTDRTNDTSGHFHNGTLRDARFPIEQNGADESVGRHGQAIYFRDGGYVEVQRSEAFDRLRTAASVEMFVRRLVVRSREVPLFALEGGLSMSLDDRGRLVARVQDGAATDTLVAPASSAITGDVWVHVAMTYDGRTKALRLYVGGEQVASSMARIGELRTSGAVTVGPRGVPAGLLLLDEVKVSDVARAPHEVRHSANVLTNRGTQRELADATPSHLRSLTRFAPRVDGFSAAAAALGEDLFAAPILSATRSTTCTSCHVAELAFTDALPIAESAEPGAPAGTRNTPTILNRLFSGFQLWDGRAGSLVEQATIPIAAAHEMNLPLDQAVERLRTEGDWAARFRAAFGEEPSVRTLATALASFEVLLFSPPTRVDRYLDGDLGALDASERRGLLLFEGKARCSGCHAGRNFTDESFRSTGLVADDDPGRAGVTGRGRDLRAFRVPTLRGLVQTAPYMHDGSFATLRQVVEAYDRGVAVDGAPVDTDIRPLQLSASEIDDLVAFLEAIGEVPGAVAPPTPPAPEEPTPPTPTPEEPSVDACTTSRFSIGETLLRGTNIQSCNRAYRLSFQSDGNLVLYRNGGGGALWASGTVGVGADRVRFQSDGNVVIRTASGSSVWSTGTNGTGASFMRVHDDGRLRAYAGDGSVVWDAADEGSEPAPPRADACDTNRFRRGETLMRNTSIESCNRAYRLTFQSDGNLVLYRNGGGSVWASRTAGVGADQVRFQSDGNVVIRTSSGRSLWSTGTHGTGAASLVVHDDGRLRVYAADGSQVWEPAR